MVSSSDRERSPETPNTPLPAGSDESVEAENAKTPSSQACNYEKDTSCRCERHSDIISRLSRACLDSLQRILRNSEQQVLPKRDLNVLRRVISAFILWDDGYGAQSGALDDKLRRPTHLHSTTLSLLRSLCKSVHSGLAKSISWTPESDETVALQTVCAALDDETGLILREARQSSPNSTNGRCIADHNSNNAERNEDECSNTDTDDDSDSDDEADFEDTPSGDHDTTTWFTSFVADIVLYTTCLSQLGNALESSALQLIPKAGVKSIKIGNDQEPANLGSTGEVICVESSSIAKVDEDGSTLLPSAKLHTSKFVRESIVEESGQKNETVPELCDVVTMEPRETVPDVDAQILYAPRYDHSDDLSSYVPPYPDLPSGFADDLFTPHFEDDLVTPSLADDLITPSVSCNSNSVSEDQAEVEKHFHENYRPFGFDALGNSNEVPYYNFAFGGGPWDVHEPTFLSESEGYAYFFGPGIDAAERVSQTPGKQGCSSNIASRQHATHHTGPDSPERAEEGSLTKKVCDEQGLKPTLCKKDSI
ncbi:hypothetical protein E8E13_007370 [Curvularia kusanoi]|uniref:Uncharacterized protein n=1 Tax=Curvularia kusanoi TaxID=90978 RepID=A0A9P4W822_CURKU|nr:hypothetical protein E8E13_007370 [Curvularia kusanoi]